MKTEDSGSKNWDDLVFENRNQEYGAYVIRKSYSDNLLSGTFLSVTLAGLILLVPLLSSFKGKEVEKKEPDVPTIFTDLPLIEVIPPPVAPPRSVIPPVKVPSSVLPPRVTTEETDDVILTNDELTASLPNTDGVEGGATSGTSGTGTVEPPAIVEPKVFDFVQVMPAYEGGMEAMYKFIQKKMRYPAVPRRMGIDGTVFVSFVVDATGSITDVKILRGAHVDLDKEAARVIALLPAWKPGKQHDRNVAVRMTLPIKFQLDR